MSYDGFSSNNGGGGGSYEGFSSSQAGGGGNFASPSQGTRDQYGGGGSGSGAAGGAKKRDPQSLIPVNCKQILDSVDRGGKFASATTGVLLPQVKLIANVLSFTQKETHLEIQAEDGSGSITVRQYIDQGSEAPQIREGSYYVFHGQIKTIGGTRCLSAFTSEPMIDANALTMHCLEIIKGHLVATKGNIKEGMGAGMGQQQQYQQGRANSAAAAAGGYAKQEQHQQGGGGAYMSDVSLPPGLVSTGDPIRDQVLAAFATGPDAGTDGGCSVTSVVQQLSHLSFLQVQAAIAALSNDGHLYSTVDEDH